MPPTASSRAPFPRSQLRDLIARGTVRADTLVWSEGMAGWQKAGEIPGLMSMPPGPPSMPQAGGPPADGGGYGGGYGGGALVGRFRHLGFYVAQPRVLSRHDLVIPAPWVDGLVHQVVRLLRACAGTPEPLLHRLGIDHRRMVFRDHRARDLIGYFTAFADVPWLNNLIYVVQLVLYWLLIRWLVANLASNGQLLGLSFSGSFWAYLGWTILTVVSFITIIGWAWVYVY